jgi:hypothetical protein
MWSSSSCLTRNTEVFAQICACIIFKLLPHMPLFDIQYMTVSCTSRSQPQPTYAFMGGELLLRRFWVEVGKK